MKRTLLAATIWILALSAASTAQAAAGDPVGNLEGASCSTVTGWSYDPDPPAAPVLGCTDPAASNYNPSATQDDGSCVIPPAQCVSRYRWITSGIDGQLSHAAACAQVGATPVSSSPRGICASGENRPNSGFGYANIEYKRGTWGGGNGGGGVNVPFQNGGYRCYIEGQEWDKDNTDIAEAFYCDFGAQYSDSCPQDGPQPVNTTRGKWSDYNDAGDNYQLNFNPGSILKAFAAVFKPLFAWAASSDSNSVLIYDGGTLVATVPANQARPDVNAVMGVSGDHGFVWTVPDSLKDGAAHSISAYGTDVDGTGSTAQLGGSPKVIQCAPPSVATNSSPNTPSLSCPANGSYTGASLPVSFSASDANGDAVRYLIDWDANGSTDQHVPSSGYAPSGAQQSSSRAWSTPGLKTVRVTAEDSQGALSGAGSCSFTLVAPPGPPQCSDGVDNDGDGLIDYPADLGCTSALDGDEAGGGSGTPQCMDGVDNDNDNLTDYPADTGCSSPVDTPEDNTTTVCVSDCDTGGTGGDGGTGDTGNTGNTGTTSGFTVSGTPKLAIQFLSDLPATSQTAGISVNPVGGFANPVAVSVQSIRTAGGADLASSVTPTYYWNGAAGTGVTLTYDSAKGQYVSPSGLIGSTFAVKLSSKIAEKHYITLVGSSGAASATYVIELDPSSIAPDFREI